MSKIITVKNVKLGGRAPLFIIAGPCVIEGRKGCMDIAKRLKALSEEEGVPLIFKASYDKANRTSHTSYRGPGIAEGLRILGEIKEKLGVPVLTDVHTEDETRDAAGVADILQLPAFLSRQTDLVTALGESGRPVNVKKAQFMAPWDIRNVIAKLEHAGCRKIILTERGASFGYNNLVADFRSPVLMKEYGYPVVFDATHSVQQPGGAGTASGGDRRMAVMLAKAAAAIGVDGIFMETHVNPDKAKSDAANSIRLADLRKLWRELKAIYRAVEPERYGRTR